MENTVGLKDFFKNLKLKMLTHRFGRRDLKYQIKWAFQRFWRGYDDRWRFSMSDSTIDTWLACLKWYRHNRTGSPVILPKNIELNDKIINEANDKREEKWDKILDEIIELFEWENKQKNEYWEDVQNIELWRTEKNEDGTYTLLDKEDYLNKEELEISNKWSARNREIERISQEKREQGLALIFKYFDCFWD